MVTYHYPAAWVDTVTRVRAATRSDRYGNEVPDWTDVDETEFAGVLVTSRSSGGTSSNELGTETRESDETGWAVYLRGEADVMSTDRIRWKGRTYFVEGAPALWPSPLGDGIHNTQIDIVETVG